MKKILLTVIITGLLILGPASIYQAKANPIVIAVKAIATKVIKAMDLAVQRLQNETIRLQNAQKQIENALSKLKLKEISEWGEKQREIFKTYYDELWKVKSIISYYQSLRNITQKHIQLVQEYKKSYGLLQKDKNFTPKQLAYMLEVYSGILEESGKNVDQFMLVINSFSTQMSDAKRMELIDAVDNRVDQLLGDLRKFTEQNIMISLETSRDEQEQNILKQYYGIE